MARHRQPHSFPSMNSTAFAARLLALQARSAATDTAAAQALSEIQQQGQQLAAAMGALADALQEAGE